MLPSSGLLLLSAGIAHALRTPAPAQLYARAVQPRAEVHANSLQLERAPPAPPPTVGGGGGGGGSGGDSEQYLRLIDDIELGDIIMDWAGRCRIYKMSDDVWVQERHGTAIEVLDRMLEIDILVAEGRRLSLGLFQGDDVRAIATAEVSTTAGLVVQRLAVHPAELHHTGSTAYARMLQGLNCLAEKIEVELSLDELGQEQPLDQMRHQLRTGEL